MFSKMLKALRMKMQSGHLDCVDVPIFCYHQISREETPEFPSICVHEKDFERQIMWLRRLGYGFLSLTDLVEHIAKGTQPPQKCAVLTFDDGYDGVYRYAWPILRKYGCPATVFLIASRLLKKEDGAGYPSMSAAQLREMVQQGIGVGSHSVHHEDLSSLHDPARLRREIVDSRKMIEDQVGHAVRHFAYPFGRFTGGVQEEVRRAGYQSACSTILGRLNAAGDLFQLKRISVGWRLAVMKFVYRTEIVSRAIDPAARTPGAAH